MRTRISLLAFVILMGNAGTLSAWWDAGHLLVATIAYDRLNPNAKSQVEALTTHLTDDYPYTNHFIASATWPDDLKGEGVHFYDSWHYTNIPYNPDHVAIPDQPEIDVIWAIRNCKSVMQRKSARNIEKARALAFLVHCVGDIHQPVHCGSMYTNEKPGGDLGGNRFDIDDDHRGLHKLWDDACGLTSDLNDINPYGKPREGLTDAEVKRLRDRAKELTQRYPIEEFTAQLKYDDPAFWAMEGHNLAVEYAYHGKNGEVNGRPVYLKPGGEPGEEYLERGREVAGRQIVLAGYRLGRLLNLIWPA